MANWLSDRPALHGELYHVRQLLWGTMQDNAQLRTQVSALSEEVQTLGLELDEIGERVDEEMRDD